jgi:hypothetical protein
MGSMATDMDDTSVSSQPADEVDARPAAYIADDGTRMIEVAPTSGDAQRRTAVSAAAGQAEVDAQTHHVHCGPSAAECSSSTDIHERRGEALEYARLEAAINLLRRLGREAQKRLIEIEVANSSPEPVASRLRSAP